LGYRYREDGLIRGKRGGISGLNTRQDWANHYRIANERARQDIEAGIRNRLIKERIEPKKFPSYLIDRIPIKNGSWKASLFYDRRKKSLYF
jgi:hypothetical protein